MRALLIFAFVLTLPAATVTRMACGGPGGTDAAGNVWTADSKLGGGAAWTVTNQPTLSSQPIPYQALCYSSGTASFSRTFTLPAGNYSVTLKFLEPNKTAAGQRTFNATINGAPVAIALDVFAAAGGALKPYDQNFQVAAPGGFIQITLAGVLGNAVLSAVQIDTVTAPAQGVSMFVESGTITVGTELVSAAPNMEIPIMTNIPGDRRYEMVTVCSTVRFLGQSRVQVSIGRPGTNHTELTGTFAPMENASNNSNCWTARPSIPQLIGPYDLVAYFEVFTQDGNGNEIPGSINALSGGQMSWEIAYFSGKIGAISGGSLALNSPVLECSGSGSHIDPNTGNSLGWDCAGMLWVKLPNTSIVGTAMIPPTGPELTWTQKK